MCILNLFFNEKHPLPTPGRGPAGGGDDIYMSILITAHCMFSACIEQTKALLMTPSEAFKQTKEKSLGSAFQYFVGLLIFFAILFAIVSVALGVAHFTSIVNQLAMFPLVGKIISSLLSHFTGFVATWKLFAAYVLFLLILFGIFLKGFMLHVFVLLFGGEKGVVQTLKTIMYAATPALLLGWIPYIWIIGLIWALVLFIIGIAETQQISIGRGIAVIVVPLILWLILIGLGAAVIASFMGAIFSLIPRPF
jgi:hypothetical protein